MSIHRRDVLLALAALSISARSASAQTITTDLTAGREVGRAYMSSNPHADLSRIRADLLPNGFTPEAVAGLRARTEADFRAARVFLYKGWRLAETEAQLFALLS